MARNDNGTIKKGTVLNPKGRPKGSKNKATTKIRGFFQKVFENHQEQFINDLAALEPKDRIKVLLEISNFILPKLRATEIHGELDVLSDDELDRMISKLEKEVD